MSEQASPLKKRPTGIHGLDSATEGGLPAAGATLIYGSAGAGKTILALQILANAARKGERSLFITFEESESQLAAAAASFTWGEAVNHSEHCRILGARPRHLAAGAGAYDLGALLSLLDHEAGREPLAWVALDATDQLLKFHPDEHAALAEIGSLNDWAQKNGTSLLLTAKESTDSTQSAGLAVAPMEFLLDTVLRLTTEMVRRRQNRRFSVRKYRGSAHSTDELPAVVDEDGIHLPYERTPMGALPESRARRVSTGVPQLDKVLRGGLWPGSTTLISGKPGTAKTSLAVAFAVAAAQRGEKTLYISFDEVPDRIIRNAASIGFDLQALIDSGSLQVSAREAWRHLVEEHYIAIQRLMDDIEASCLVIDPISALDKAASAEGAYIAAERILSAARSRGVTTLMTSLADIEAPGEEATLSHTSTLVETWITLGYESRAGERNRSLSVVKARGTAHSNQVRELILGNDGIRLAEVYQFGSEVLMGTARVQKEAEERAAHEAAERRQRQRRQEIEHSIAERRREVDRLEKELEAALGEERYIAQQAQSARETILRRREPGPNPPALERSPRAQQEGDSNDEQ